MELEASLWESLSVMNQICKANEHMVCPVRRVSVCSVYNYSPQDIFIFPFGWGLGIWMRLGGKGVLPGDPDIVGTDMKQDP